MTTVGDFSNEQCSRRFSTSSKRGQYIFLGFYPSTGYSNFGLILPPFESIIMTISESIDISLFSLVFLDLQLSGLDENWFSFEEVGCGSG